MRKFFIFDHLAEKPDIPIPVPISVKENEVEKWVRANYTYATIWYREIPDVEYCSFAHVDQR